MVRNLRLSSLIPAGLVIEAIAENEGVLVITARSGTPARPCPLPQSVEPDPQPLC